MHTLKADRIFSSRYTSTALFLLLGLSVGACDLFNGGDDEDIELNGQWNLVQSELDGEAFAVGDSLILVVDETEVSMYDYRGDPYNNDGPCYALIPFDLEHQEDDMYDLIPPPAFGNDPWEVNVGVTANVLTVTFLNGGPFEGVTETYHRTNHPLSTFTPLCPGQKTAGPHRWNSLAK
jgi:hypothetical protein